MVEAINLTKKYGKNVALCDVSFTLERGKIYGLLGVNGAGKSTTLQLLSGFFAPSRGEVRIDGISMEKAPAACKRKISYLPEVPPLYPEFTVREYLSFAAELKGIKKSERRTKVEQAIRKGMLRRVEGRLVSQLSKGFRQRVSLASAMLGDPEVFLLDEPVNGLDPVQIVTFREQLTELKKEKVIVLSSHVLSEIEQLADEYLILAGGRLILRGNRENLLSENGAGNLEELFLTATKKAYEEISRKEAEEEAAWAEEDGDD